MKLVIVALVLGVLLFTVGPVYGFKSKVTATVKAPSFTHKITVYVLYGPSNQGYKEKSEKISDVKKVTIKVTTPKGTPAHVCAFDKADDERFKCSKQITIDQKKENVKIDLRNT